MRAQRALRPCVALWLVLTLEHADDHALAVRLVTFVQGVGFVIASLGRSRRSWRVSCAM
jgi:cyanate permease